MAFSARTAWNREPNRLAARAEELRAQGATLVDLTESNPTRCEFEYAWDAIQRALARSAVYAPEPLGLAGARESVAAYYAERGANVDPRAVALTASTSEAYAFLLKLLCEPGDDVLVPAPCYPLLDFLTGLESVSARSYPLRAEDGWSVDVDALARVGGPRTRAVIAISPGNPTGTFLRSEGLARLQALCASRGWAFLCDEVFADYGQGADLQRVRTVAGIHAPALTFALSGLSKVAGLPQLKLSWLVASGPPELRDDALARLELVSDTYLSVGTPVQQALPELLAKASGFQQQVRERIRLNRAKLASVRPADAAWSILPSDGGWYAVLRVPQEPPEEERCLKLLDAGVVVHPGYFFDFPSPGYLVVSLILPPAAFARGAEALATAL